MGSGKLQLHLLLLLLAVRGVDAFTYDCHELQNRFDGDKFLDNLTVACVILQEGYSNFDQLKKFHLSDGKIISFADIANSANHCVETKSLYGWTITMDSDINCDQQFSLVMTEAMPKFILPLKQPSEYILEGGNLIAVPQTGMWLHKKSCVGSGNVTVSTGVGPNEAYNEVTYRSWSCELVPDWIFSFDIVITIDASDATYIMECSSDKNPVTAFPGDSIAVLTSGRSNDLQNLQGYDNGARIQIKDGSFEDVIINMQLTFDARNSGSVTLQANQGTIFHYRNGEASNHFNTSYFEIQYMPQPLQPSEIYINHDFIIVEASIRGPILPPATTSRPESGSNDSKCNCGVDKFDSPVGWRYSDIWLDLVVVLDTSEAMGQSALDDAGALIESFISDGVDDFLITDTMAPFYTRVGVISMADTATIMYDLNMTKTDKVQGKVAVKSGVTGINFDDAFKAAISMLNGGLKSKPDRVNTRQVIYYITDSHDKDILISENVFKSSNIIIVNNFLQKGEVERPALKTLASDGYYFVNSNYMEGLQAFCKANCFCKPGKDAYGGADPAMKAADGCYYATSAGVPYSKAKTTCTSEGGILASNHDADKGRFLNTLMTSASSRSDYFWLGYQKTDDGVWRWEDQSSDPYTNWGEGEPSSASVAKCGYVDRTTPNLAWGAGNCQLGFPYICQYRPCSVGNKDC